MSVVDFHNDATMFALSSHDRMPSQRGNKLSPHPFSSFLKNHVVIEGNKDGAFLCGYTHIKERLD